MLDTNKLDTAEAEMGITCEQLLTPLTRFRAVRPFEHFGVDNGAFTGFDRRGFLSLLEREKDRKHLCRFVVAPDVVGSARRTLEVFNIWKHELSGWPLALAAQDGQEYLPIPWDEISAVFIGGSTGWKMSPHAAHIIRAAKILGKWVHVGRINGPTRLKHFEAMQIDSFDGSGIAQYSHMRAALSTRHESPPTLFEQAA